MTDSIRVRVSELATAKRAVDVIDKLIPDSKWRGDSTTNKQAASALERFNNLSVDERIGVLLAAKRLSWFTDMIVMNIGAVTVGIEQSP